MCDLMKIRGVYILTLRNIKRMIAVLAAAFFASCTSATSPENIAIAGRISNATLTLKVLECSALASGAACVVVPDIQYVECKALYHSCLNAEICSAMDNQTPDSV